MLETAILEELVRIRVELQGITKILFAMKQQEKDYWETWKQAKTQERKS